MPLALFEVREHAAIITINRPDRRNALSRQLVADLLAAFERALADPAVRAIILTGAGSAFCAGMDLAEVASTLNQPGEAEAVNRDADQLSGLFDLIYRSPKPTLAAVNGAAVAGGAGLMTVCDFAIAAPSALFGYPEVKRGLVAAMVMPHLLRHVGERAARELLLRGNLIPAGEALRIGLINAVAEEGQLLNLALRWVTELREAGPEALAVTKRLLAEMGHLTEAIRRHTAAESAGARLHVEAKEGLLAFLEKRPAPWAR